MLLVDRGLIFEKPFILAIGGLTIHSKSRDMDTPVAEINRSFYSKLAEAPNISRTRA